MNNQKQRNCHIVCALVVLTFILGFIIYGFGKLIFNLTVNSGNHSIVSNVLWSLTMIFCVSIVAFVFLIYVLNKNKIDSKDMTISLTTKDIETINKMFVENKVTGYYVTKEDIKEISSTLSEDIQGKINENVVNSISEEKIEEIIEIKVKENSESNDKEK